MTKVILRFQAAGFPLTLSKVCSLAYQYADLNSIKGFSSKTKKVGRKWAKFYLKCYPEIRVKKASNLSIARAMAANEPNVHKWFDEYKQVLKDLGINSPEQYGLVMRQVSKMFQRNNWWWVLLGHWLFKL